jgi:hypothetical protein
MRIGGNLLPDALRRFITNGSAEPETDLCQPADAAVKTANWASKALV